MSIWRSIRLRCTNKVNLIWSENKDGHHCLWLTETIWTSLKPLGAILQNFTRSKNSTSSTKFVFFRVDGKIKMATLAFWLAETFFTSPLQRLNRIHMTKLDRKKYSIFSTELVLFGYRKRKTGTDPLNGGDFSSALPEGNLMKFHWKQVLIFLYQVCFSLADTITKVA